MNRIGSSGVCTTDIVAIGAASLLAVLVGFIGSASAVSDASVRHQIK